MYKEASLKTDYSSFVIFTTPRSASGATHSPDSIRSSGAIRLWATVFHDIAAAHNFDNPDAMSGVWTLECSPLRHK